MIQMQIRAMTSPRVVVAARIRYSVGGGLLIFRNTWTRPQSIEYLAQ